ncbi:GDSL lipase/esterase [Dillenia turbinata]|uniref:GDSL lipase/esterase n=1 Tax=Dillenia turbinata TaxID=194707 RepID=A0AAN8V2N4_9MAGN
MGNSTTSIGRIISVSVGWMLWVILGAAAFDFGAQEIPLFNEMDVSISSPSPSVSGLFVLGDSSVDCGANTLFYPLLHRTLSLLPCNGSDASLLPQLLAARMGFKNMSTFYLQNGTIREMVSGIIFGSAQATIMNLPSSQTHQSLNQQLRQAFETLQLLHLQLGPHDAQRIIESSIFYLSFGKEDYLNHNFSNLNRYTAQQFAHILVDQMTVAIKNLYNANGRKFICMGVLPLGCAPRTMWERQSMDYMTNYDTIYCIEDVNQLVLEYNKLLEQRITDLNRELTNVQITFCDVYEGIMQIIINPESYGFEDAKSACCGNGWRGGRVGCESMKMACPMESSHVWWDFYNPTHAVNSLLADSAWSGHPFPNLCRPMSVQDLASSSP